MKKTGFFTRHPLLSATIIMAAFPITLLVNSFVVATLWSWFVVDTFSLPTLTIGNAFGLVMLATAVRSPPKQPKPEPAADLDDAMWILLTPMWVNPLVAITLGYIASQWGG